MGEGAVAAEERGGGVSARVTLRVVGPAEHALLRNLYALYLHDLSEFTDAYHLDAEGRWTPDYLPTWLEESPQVHPLLIEADGQVAGFAFVGEAPFPYMTPGRDFRLAEFFVLRASRRHGIGRAAALAVFERFRGEWEVAQVPANTPAQRFWRRVINEYTRGCFLETAIGGCPTQTFDNRET